VIRCALLVGEPAADPGEVLTPEEQALLGPRAVRKRRDDLLRGRLVAKRLLCALLPGCTPLELSVLPDEAGAPVVWREGRRLAWSLSISHTGGIAAAAAVEHPGAVGIDVERVIESPRLIAEDYLTADERHLAGADGALGVTRVWCVRGLQTAVRSIGLVSAVGRGRNARRVASTR
jgi:4'-phosphopantetheinyl transferase EntD